MPTHPVLCSLYIGTDESCLVPMNVVSMRVCLSELLGPICKRGDHVFDVCASQVSICDCCEAQKLWAANAVMSADRARDSKEHMLTGSFTGQ